MAGWLIYVPGGKTRPHELPLLEGVIRADDVALRDVVAESGPDGKGGRLWYAADESRTQSWPHLEFSAERQCWKRAPDRSFWLGWLRESPPGPDDLLRGVQPRFSGWPCALSGRQLWTVPNSMNLSMAYDFDEAGQLTLRPTVEHQPIYDRCLQALQVAQDACVLSAPIHEGNLRFAVDHCGAMLALNYRINATLAVMLGLFDARSLWQCLCLTTDVDAINALIDDLEKKSLSETGDSPPSSSGSTG